MVVHEQAVEEECFQCSASQLERCSAAAATIVTAILFAPVVTNPATAGRIGLRSGWLRGSVRRPAASAARSHAADVWPRISCAKKLLPGQRRREFQVEQRQKINRLELTIQRGRAADFRAKGQVSPQQLGDL